MLLCAEQQQGITLVYTIPDNIRPSSIHVFGTES